MLLCVFPAGPGRNHNLLHSLLVRSQGKDREVLGCHIDERIAEVCAAGVLMHARAVVPEHRNWAGRWLLLWAHSSSLSPWNQLRSHVLASRRNQHRLDVDDGSP